MYDRIVELLAAIGYNTISDSDRIILNFAISKVESEIKNEINWKEIPQGLENVLICRVVGEFLLHKKTFAPADLSMLDLSGGAVKQIQAGDTNFVFSVDEGGESASGRLSTFINYLLTCGADQFSAFRRIRW